MFQIFRRHQKVLLTSIAVIAIGSMAFSAIAPLFLDQNSQSGVSKELISDPTRAISCLFDHSFDAASKEIVFPEPIFTDVILNTGILEKAYAVNPQAVDSELEVIFSQISAYVPCEVIQGATMVDVLGQMSGELKTLYSDLMKASQLSGAKKIALLSAFFKEKNKFPLPLVYQYLQAVSKGNVLASYDEICFFGLKTPSDFFGKTLIDTSVKLLVSALSKEAATQKPQVLMAGFAAKLKSFYGQDVHPNSFFVAIGVSPEAGLNALKHFAALNSLKESLKDGLLLDPISYQAFSEFASKRLPVAMYTFSHELEPKSLEDAVYLEQFAKLKTPLSVDKYDIKVRTLDKTKAIAKLPKKKLYEQALSGYKELSDMMPYALSQNLIAEKDRLEAIKSLSGASAEIMNAHVQKAMVKSDPQFFQKMLQEQNLKQETLWISKSGKQSPLAGFISLDQLKTELEMMPLNTPVMFEVGDRFMHEIEIVQKAQNTPFQNFSQAMASGVLKERLMEELEPTYRDAIKKTPVKFLNADKKTKTLEDSFSDVIELYAKDLKKQLADILGVSSDVSSSMLIKAYPKYVLASSDLKKEDFRIEKQTSHISRYEASDFHVANLFKAKDHTKTPVILGAEGRYVIYEKLGSEELSEPVMDKKALDILAHDKLKTVLAERIGGMK